MIEIEILIEDGAGKPGLCDIPVQVDLMNRGFPYNFLIERGSLNSSGEIQFKTNRNTHKNIFIRILPKMIDNSFKVNPIIVHKLHKFGSIYKDIPLNSTDNNGTNKVLIKHDRSDEFYITLQVMGFLHKAYQRLITLTDHRIDFIKVIPILNFSKFRSFRSLSIPFQNIFLIQPEDFFDQQTTLHEFSHQIFYKYTGLKFSTVLSEFTLGDLNWGEHYLRRKSNPFNALFEGYPEGLSWIIMGENPHIEPYQLFEEKNIGYLYEGAIAMMMIELHKNLPERFYEMFIKPLSDLQLKHIGGDKITSQDYCMAILNNNIKYQDDIRVVMNRWNMMR